MEPNFVHLRIHSEYSILDGIVRIPELMEKAQSFAMPALAITDMNNLYATVKFYKEAYQFGIKPIIGADIRIPGVKENEFCRLTLLCQNNIGYNNLLKIISYSFLEGQKLGLPVVALRWIEAYSEGLILLSGDCDGDIGQAILSNRKEKAESLLQYWQTLFPKRFYLEISRVGRRQENLYISHILKYAEKYQLPIVATNDVRFLEKDEFEAHEARVCIQEGVILNDPNRQRKYTEQQYFRSTREMQKLFSDLPEALSNSVEIAKRCNVTFELGKISLPHFEVPVGDTTESYLSKIAQLGLEERLDIISVANKKTKDEFRKPYDERLARELEVINSMGFAGYFLIVADFTKWAKQNGIPVGPGRGSGPGSLVAYVLKITDLDPIALKLLFERFLNPERVSMPDFDIDFCMDGRDKVIDYVMQRHGADSVSQIITYGTMAAKAVVRDVGRVLGHNYGFVDKIAKLIPFELGMTLEKALDQEILLRERYQNEEEIRTLIDLALKLEGLTRNVGKHAGGIVIAPGKLTDFVPVYCEENEKNPVTQFDKDDVEAVGLVKFDFLGLRTLTIIDRALHVINDILIKDNQSPIDISLIPLDDEKTFQLLKNCKTTAVFQLESHGMRDLIKRLQPDCFEDLIALVALFRPGPLQAGAADDFINRKHGRAKIEYAHPSLLPILSPTYGAFVYQEQVMQVAQALAGYTLGGADILRKAMGKKKPEEMAKQREIFCNGAIERNVKSQIATQLFDMMEKFAGYGFNKSHSAAYALIAYQTAWLKTHYTSAFMAAVLSSEMDKTEKILTLLEDCDAFGLHVSPPDINKSNYNFTRVDEKNILYGLGAIKGVGLAAIENILIARESTNASGNTTGFKDLYDFCQRVDLRKVNRRVLEALIKSGCFDSLGVDRAILMASLNNALQHAEQVLHNATYGQHDLLGMCVASDTATVQYVAAEPWPNEVQLQGEKETLGFYLSGHPLNRYLNELANFTTCRISEIEQSHQNVRLAGIIQNIRIRQTKRGDRMAVFKIDDGASQIDVVCFSDCFNKYRHLIVQDQLVIIEGDISLDDFNMTYRLTGREVYSIDAARERFGKTLNIIFSDINTFNVQHLKQLLLKNIGGNCKVVLTCLHDKTKTNITFSEAWRVKPTESLLKSIQEELQVDTPRVEY